MLKACVRSIVAATLLIFALPPCVVALPESLAIRIPVDQPQALPNAFAFADGSQFAENDKRHQFATWSEADRKDVQTALQAIALTRPRLLRSCLLIGPVNFYRFASKERFDGKKTGDGIVLTDTFFREDLPTRTTTLMHELAHWVDGAGEVSYDPRWAEYALPVISHVRTLYILRGPASDSWLTLPEARAAWPTLYATKSLTESVAECYWAAAVKNSAASPLSFVQMWLIDKIENLSAADARAVAMVNAGQLQLDNSNWTDAANDFVSAQQTFSSNPIVAGWLAIAYFGSKQYVRADQAHAKATEYFDNVHVGHFEPGRRLYDAPWSRRMGRKPISNPTCAQLLMYDGDKAFVARELDEYVKREKDSPESLQLRAEWHDAEGDTVDHGASK